MDSYCNDVGTSSIKVFKRRFHDALSEIVYAKNVRNCTNKCKFVTLIISSYFFLLLCLRCAFIVILHSVPFLWRHILLLQVRETDARPENVGLSTGGGRSSTAAGVSGGGPQVHSCHCSR